MTFLLLPTTIPRTNSATVTRWHKVPGEPIAAGEVVVSLETAEGQVEIEATEAGQLTELLAQPGQTVALGDKLGRMVTSAASAALTSPPQAKEQAVSKTGGGQPSKVTPILMPQAGNTMEEGTVLSWRVAPGDQIAIGQVLCEIETDKATMDFESPDAGRLAKIVAPEGEPVAVKAIIALLADNDADAAAFLAESESPATTSPSTAAAAQQPRPMAAAVSSASATGGVTSGPNGRIKASPAARKAAAAAGIGLESLVAGSGPQGRILSTDVAKQVQAAGAPFSGGEIRRPLSKMRRAIGLNLQQSKQTVPHFYVRTTIDADPLLAFYREQKAATTCTLNDIIILAVGRVMREFPAVRSQISGNEIIEYPHANIGIAVGIDDGLVVPVVAQVDTLSLAGLAAETRRTIEQARKGRLENVGKGHFTISNLGMFGVEEFSAIINPPESGILAVSAARESVIVENGAMRVGRLMTLTLSADHRIVDGVLAAKFMQRLQAVLQHPAQELN